MSNNINFDYKNLSPFKWFVLENFPFIEADFDALTEWQLFCKIGKEINKIIDSQNIVGEQAENLTNAFNNLKNYVDNYFDNLDVQDEINNKLNEMAQNGTLENIIGLTFNYFNINYKTINELLNDENLKDNTFITTYGYNTFLDTNINHFYITSVKDENKINLQLKNNLFAQLLDEVLNVEILNLNSLDELSNYNLTSINKIILDKDYSLNNNLELNNIELDLNNNNIIPDLKNHFNIILNNNCIITNGKFHFIDYSLLTENNGICIKIIGNNNIIDNINFNGYISIFSNNDIENLEVKNCILNSFRHEILLTKGRFKNIKIYNNKQTNPQNYSIPCQHHNIIQILNKISFPLKQNELTQDLIDNFYGNNIIIDNNEFNTINTRSVNIINCHNVNIINNKTYNPFGDKINHSLVGYSDDVYVIDLCKYCNISNNLVQNSGENGIDVLSCKNVTVSGNKLIGTDSDGIDIALSDMVPEKVVNNDVTNNTLISENISVVNNIIDTVKLGIRIGCRNSNFNGNTIKNENAKDKVSIAFTSYSALNSVGNYGNIDCTGNNIDKNMNLGITGGGNAIFVNDESNIVLDENSGLKVDYDIDNSTLENNTDTKLYVYTHSLKFKHFKMYVIVDKNLIELPLFSANNKGLVNFDNGKYHFYFTFFKKFANIPVDAQSASYRDLTKGKIKIIFY